MTKTLLLIPARMASTRLPGKPMAEINGLPMICHVVDRAREADIGKPVVATDSHAIKNAVRAHGAEAVMTRTDHESGSDRIWEAVEKIDPDEEAEIILNIQGDLPTIEPEFIRQAISPLDDPRFDMSTIATEITDEAEKTNPNVVKAIGTPIGHERLQALYFTRATAPYGNGPLYHHIGLYAYRRSALKRFVSLAPSTLEKRENLEQLRALENNLKIAIELVQAAPLGVDTLEDLEKARHILGGTKS